MAENDIVPRGILRGLRDGDIVVLESAFALRRKAATRIRSEIELLAQPATVRVLILEDGLRLADTGAIDGWATEDSVRDLREGRAAWISPNPSPEHPFPVSIGDPE